MKRPAASLVTPYFTAMALVASLALFACTGDGPKGGDAQLLGVVTSIDRGDAHGMLVAWDASLGPQLEYDAAFVTVTDDTGIFRRTSENGHERIPADDLRVRDVVEVWITGPVMESYPVQAGADQVVVVARWPEAEPLPVPPGLTPPE